MSGWAGGYVVLGYLPALAVSRAVCIVWSCCFIMFFVATGLVKADEALIAQRQITASWFAPIYTGHLATDAFMCMSGICVGRKLMTQVGLHRCRARTHASCFKSPSSGRRVCSQRGGIALNGFFPLLMYLKDRFIRIYPPYAAASLVFFVLRAILPLRKPLTQCTTSAWLSELLMLQTTLPFDQQCSPWLWPVAITAKLTLVVTSLAMLAGRALSLLRAIARTHAALIRFVRKVSPTPASVVKLGCLFGAVTCFVRLLSFPSCS